LDSFLKKYPQLAVTSSLIDIVLNDLLVRERLLKIFRLSDAAAGLKKIALLKLKRGMSVYL
jgi:hypothetical protein